MSKLHVSKFNQASDAPVVALLHGWGSSSKIWQSCIKVLARDFQIWCIDLPGHGKSKQVEWDATVAQGLTLLANSLPERCHVVGWSLGGLFAQLFVKRYPQRVKSLMLIASTPKFVASDNWPHAMPNDTFTKFAKQFAVAPQATLKQFSALQTLHGASSKEIMHSLEQASSYQHHEKIAWGLQWLEDVDLRKACIAKDLPMQLLQGENDQVSSLKAAEQSADLWQSSRTPHHNPIQLCKIPKASHVPFLSHSKLFYNQLDFMITQSKQSTNQ